MSTHIPNPPTEELGDNGPLLPSSIQEDESEDLEIKAAGEERSDDELKRQESKFKEGQILRFVRIRFPGNAKSFPFLIGKRRLSYGQKVVAMSDRGMAVGYINSFPYEVPFNKTMLPLRSINKIATDEDIKKQEEHYRKEKEFESICLTLIEKYNLDMNLTHVEFTQFGKKAVFYFTAPARVDFRDLVKDLVSELKMRIELRQISLRDRASAIGGIGPCGRQLCCSSFLAKYGNVGIKMAKNQNLTLTYSKLNGVCGQLKCCLQYEDEVYAHKRSLLPEEGALIQLKNGDFGRTERLHILSEQFDLLTDQGVMRRYSVSQYDPKLSHQTNKKMPEFFDHVTDETSTVIGLEIHLQDKAADQEESLLDIKEEARDFAQEVFGQLFISTEKEPTKQSEIPEREEVVTEQSSEIPHAENPVSEKDEREERNRHHNRHRNRNHNHGRHRHHKNFNAKGPRPRDN